MRSPFHVPSLTGSLIIIAVFFAYLTFSDQGLARLYHLNQTEDMIIQKNKELRNEIQLLKLESNNLHKLSYLERVARQELGVLKSNEILYYVGEEPLDR